MKLPKSIDKRVTQMQPPLSVFLNSCNRNPDADYAVRLLQEGKHAFLIIVKIGQIFSAWPLSRCPPSSISSITYIR